MAHQLLGFARTNAFAEETDTGPGVLPTDEEGRCHDATRSLHNTRANSATMLTARRSTVHATIYIEALVYDSKRSWRDAVRCGTAHQRGCTVSCFRPSSKATSSSRARADIAARAPHSVHDDRNWRQPTFLGTGPDSNPGTASNR